jgi:replicative DNA helicase
MTSDEYMLLGQVVLDNSILHKLSLTAKNFTDSNCRRLFNTMHKMNFEQVEINDLTLADYNVPMSVLNKLNAPTSTNWKYYEKKIREHSQKLMLESLGNKIKDWSETEEIEKTLEYIEAELYDITATSTTRQISTAKDIIMEVLQEIESAMKGPHGIPGITTGIHPLDSMVLGFQKRLFYIFGARPSGGKTALLVNFLVNAAVKEKLKAGFISAESSAKEIIYRAISNVGKVESQIMKTGSMTREQFSRVYDSCTRIGESEIYFSDTPNMTLQHMVSEARRLVTYHKCNIIYIDYIQNIQVITGNRYTPNHERVGMVTTAMKALANELEIPIVAVAQLNRGAEGERPELKDFKDSGKIEQDGDVIGALYHYKDDQGIDNSALVMLKQRDGAIGDIPVHFERKYVNFTPIEKEYTK